MESAAISVGTNTNTAKSANRTAAARDLPDILRLSQSYKGAATIATNAAKSSGFQSGSSATIAPRQSSATVQRVAPSACEVRLAAFSFRGSRRDAAGTEPVDGVWAVLIEAVRSKRRAAEET